MASLTPAQTTRRERVESLIAVVAPALDLLLAAGERLSRLAGGPADSEPLAVHPSDYRPPRLPPPRG